MKTISLLFLSLVMVLVNPAFAREGSNGGGGGMSQADMDAAKQKMTTQSDQAADQNAQPETNAAQDQTKADSTTKQ